MVNNSPGTDIDQSKDTQISNNPKHAKLFELEEILLSLPQVEKQTEHKFCDGMYARTLLIPKGTILTGAVHLHECFFIVRSGDILINDGEETKRVHSGFMCISPNGAKRAGLALDDTVVTTIHLNLDNETNLDALWGNLFVEKEGK